MSGQPSPAVVPATLAEVLALADASKAVTPAMLKGMFCGFAANRTSDQSSLTDGAANKISFNNELFDSHGYFDPTTNFRFTPLVAGTYLAWMMARSATGTADGPQSYVYKNGAVAVIGSYAIGTASFFNSTAIGVVALNGSTDYIEGYCYLPTGITTCNAGTNGGALQFGAIRLGN